MDLYLRKVRHPHSYRVIMKQDETEFQIGSIGIQYHRGPDAVWVWGIDTVIPMREVESQGQGKDRAECMKKFRAAWEKFCAEPGRLVEFLEMKRISKRPWVK